jgi:hypothetical protein
VTRKGLFPQPVKPSFFSRPYGTTKVVPFQNSILQEPMTRVFEYHFCMALFGNSLVVLSFDFAHGAIKSLPVSKNRGDTVLAYFWFDHDVERPPMKKRMHICSYYHLAVRAC